MEPKEYFLNLANQDPYQYNELIQFSKQFLNGTAPSTVFYGTGNNGKSIFKKLLAMYTNFVCGPMVWLENDDINTQFYYDNLIRYINYTGHDLTDYYIIIEMEELNNQHIMLMNQYIENLKVKFILITNHHNITPGTMPMIEFRAVLNDRRAYNINYDDYCQFITSY